MGNMDTTTPSTTTPGTTGNMDFLPLTEAVGLTEFDIERVAALHRALAPSRHAYDIIHTHCVIVARLALSLARADAITHADGTPLDERLLAMVMIPCRRSAGTYKVLQRSYRRDHRR